MLISFLLEMTFQANPSLQRDRKHDAAHLTAAVKLQIADPDHRRPAPGRLP
jgi:hypothetical protein